MNGDEVRARLLALSERWAQEKGYGWALSPGQVDEITSLVEEALRQQRSWEGLLSILDEHYPPDVFDGSSPDPGARMVVLVRALNQERENADKYAQLAQDLGVELAQVKGERDRLRAGS